MRVLLAMILVLGGVAGVLFGGSGDSSLAGSRPTATPPANSNSWHNSNANGNWNMNGNMNMSNTNADDANR